MKKGFTLLELIISLAIISTVLLGLQTLLRAQLNYGEHSWRYREAVDLAASALETRTYAGRNIQIEKSGYTLTETAIPKGAGLDVTVTVHWADGIAENNIVSLHREYYPEVD